MSVCACPKECSQQQPHSPGVVLADEPIVYILLQPDHWAEGLLTAAAFAKSRLSSGTLSVCRAARCTADEANASIVQPQLQKDSRRVLVGALRARCSDIREIKVEAQRAVCVIDDGLANFPAHAVLAYSEATKQEKFWERNQRSAVRAELARVFGLPPGPLSLQDCWGTQPGS
jgi:hypothetical protein